MLFLSMNKMFKEITKQKKIIMMKTMIFKCFYFKIMIINNNIAN